MDELAVSLPWIGGISNAKVGRKILITIIEYLLKSNNSSQYRYLNGLTRNTVVLQLYIEPIF